MERVLQGIPHHNTHIDDILVTGKDEKEHLAILAQVLKRLWEHGLRLKRTKCYLMRAAVDHLGGAPPYSQQGGGKEAIVEAPTQI